ncbi:MAG: T9SS type A sorting domain-containing protein, partial [Bacteroidota bacterium]
TAKSQALTHTGCPTGTVAPFVAKSDLYSSDNEVNTFTIYPNPNNGNFEISIQLKDTDHSLSTISISNIFGNIVKKITVGSLNGKIEASVRNLNLPKGIYFVNYNFGKSNQNIKMIIN